MKKARVWGAEDDKEATAAGRRRLGARWARAPRRSREWWGQRAAGAGRR
jgi:hypothetical protein